MPHPRPINQLTIRPVSGGYEGDEEKEEEEEEVKASAPAATRTAAEAKAEALRRAQQLQSGIESVSSVPGIETPEAINLRKSGTGTETPGTVAGGRLLDEWTVDVDG